MLNPKEAFSFDDLMLVPQHGVLETRKDADISSELVDDWPLLVPIVSANMPSVTEDRMMIAMWSLGAASVLHRFNTIEEQIEIISRTRGTGFAAAIGLKDGLKRTEALKAHRVKIFVLDVAHADTEPVIRFVKKWRNCFDDDYFIVGNVATPSAAERLADAGVDAIKVGIGPGAACVTREVTGFGVPQLSAIANCSLIKENFYPDIKIIADGGIRNSGDIVKALAAGADTVMVGRLLAGCDEAPYPGRYFGNASKKMNGHNAPEGIEGKVPKTGPVESVIKKLAWGIRSGISYAGATNIKELQKNAEWIKVSNQTLQESGTRL